jgi:hypothetical protein
VAQRREHLEPVEDPAIRRNAVVGEQRFQIAWCRQSGSLSAFFGSVPGSNITGFVTINSSITALLNMLCSVALVLPIVRAAYFLLSIR